MPGTLPSIPAPPSDQTSLLSWAAVVTTYLRNLRDERGKVKDEFLESSDKKERRSGYASLDASGKIPEVQLPASALLGNLVHLNTTDASGATSVDWNNAVLQNTVYSIHVIYLSNIDVSVDNVWLGLRFSEDGGSSYSTANYRFGNHAVGSGATLQSSGSANGGAGLITMSTTNWKVGNQADEEYGGMVVLYGMGTATGFKRYTYAANWENNSTVGITAYGGGMWYGGSESDDVDAVQIVPESGTITGKLSIYGIGAA